MIGQYNDEITRDQIRQLCNCVGYLRTAVHFMMLTNNELSQASSYAATRGNIKDQLQAVENTLDYIRKIEDEKR